MSTHELPFSSQKYYFQAELQNEEGRPFIPLENLQQATSRNFEIAWIPRIFSGCSLPWLLFTVLLSLNILFSTHLLSGQRVAWTITDFKPARNQIANKLVKFSSSLEFLDEKNIVRVFDPTEPKYVGNETEIERNWDALIMPEYNDIKISADEAVGADEDLWFDAAKSKYTIEIEVFHSLHCLNMLRKRIYSHNYPEMLSNNAGIHVDHCIEALRELIMCGGDMTPIPVKWSESGNKVNPDFATVHFCRDFEKLKEWMVLRGSIHGYQD